MNEVDGRSGSASPTKIEFVKIEFQTNNNDDKHLSSNSDTSSRDPMNNSPQYVQQTTAFVVPRLDLSSVVCPPPCKTPPISAASAQNLSNSVNMSQLSRSQSMMSRKSDASSLLTPRTAPAGVFGSHLTPRKDRESIRLATQLKREQLIPGPHLGYEYTDYTHDDTALNSQTFSSERVRERLMKNRGNHWVGIRWCGYCEKQAQHCFRAWAILTKLMQDNPDFDYTNALPTENTERRPRQLMWPEKHRWQPSQQCKEMYVLLKPRGKELKSLQASDGITASTAIKTCLNLTAPANMSVTLQCARNLPKQLFSKPNPYVRFTLGSQQIISGFCENTTNPDFKTQLFTFHVDNPNQEELQVEVLSHVPTTKKPKTLGTCSVPLHDLKTGEINRRSYDLTGCKNGNITIVLQAEGAPFPKGNPYAPPSPGTNSKPASGENSNEPSPHTIPKSSSQGMTPQEGSLDDNSAAERLQLQEDPEPGTGVSEQTDYLHNNSPSPVGSLTGEEEER